MRNKALYWFTTVTAARNVVWPSCSVSCENLGNVYISTCMSILSRELFLYVCMYFHHYWSLHCV